jgi:hypothetical protein
MKKITFLSMVFLSLCGFIKAEQVVYSVLTPSTTNLCYIAGVPTAWVKTPMHYVSMDETGKKLFTITLDVDLTNPANKDTYKYLSGPLYTFEEKKADGTLWSPGRTYPGAGVNDEVANWVYVCTPFTVVATLPIISPETNVYLKGNFYATGTTGDITSYYPRYGNGNSNTKLTKQLDGTYSVTIYSNRSSGSGFGYYKVHAGNGDAYNEVDVNGVTLAADRSATVGINNITVERWNMIENGMKFTVNVPSDISTCYISNPSFSNPPFWAMNKNGAASSFSIALTQEIVSDANFAYLYYKTASALNVEKNASNEIVTVARTIPYLANTTKVDDVVSFADNTTGLKNYSQFILNVSVKDNKAIVSFEGTKQVKLYNVMGQLIQNSKENNQVQFNNLKENVYFVSIEGDVRKFIVNK